MTYSTDPAASAGPNGDGSRSLAKESKVGLAVQFVLTGAATGLLSWLAGLDTSHWSGYLGLLGIGAVSTGAGMLSAWLKRNR